MNYKAKFQKLNKKITLNKIVKMKSILKKRDIEEGPKK